MCCCIDYFEYLLLSDAERSKPSTATGDGHSPDRSGQEEYGGGDGGTPSIVGTPSSSGGTNTPSVTRWDLDNIPRFVPHASGTACWCGVDCFYTSLFSALKRIDCALVARDSEWVSDCSLYECVFECSLKCVLTALFGFTRLMPCETAAISAHVLCRPYSHAPVRIDTSCLATYVGCMCVYL